MYTRTVLHGQWKPLFKDRFLIECTVQAIMRSSQPSDAQLRDTTTYVTRNNSRKA